MKRFLILILFMILAYTRFVNIQWGLPYPLQPDERNMAAAVQNLNCSLTPQASEFRLSECFNPRFFAYGQLPLYLAYGGIQAYRLPLGIIGQPTYVEATIALRVVSAISSITLVWVLLLIMRLVYPKKFSSAVSFELLALGFFTFSPYAIQLAHFGTTESLLMLFYALIVYHSLKLFVAKDRSWASLFYLALFSGLALGTKMSSLPFLGIPIIVYSVKIIGGSHGRAPDSAHLADKRGALVGRTMTSRIYYFYQICVYIILSLIIFILSSPHNFLNWNDFILSMTYESRVGLGRFVAFYTRQFIETPPVIFQLTKILPYVLGWPQLLLALCGLMFLPSHIGHTVFLQVAKLKGPATRGKSAASRLWQLLSTDGKRSILTESAKMIDVLRFSLLLSFLPSSFFFAKWTRFISPSFPLFSLFALLFVYYLFLKYAKSRYVRYVIFLLCAMSAIPGIAFLSVYTSQDIRFTASEWMYKNMPEGSKILSETANVIDIPVPSPNSDGQIPKNLLVNSFNFYDLDQDINLQTSLDTALMEADYIVIPSRRIFFNSTCVTENATQTTGQRCEELYRMYPLLTRYYQNLFSGKAGFRKIAEFSSYPRISLFGKTIVEFPDESAEETWTVFDHPVIRIYQRSARNLASEWLTDKDKLDFSAYESVDFKLPPHSFRLLVADTQEKWAKGLMFVQNKDDMKGNDGMIFLFPTTETRSFWNKNTLSPLTLYWIKNKKVVGTTDMPSITQSGVVQSFASPSEVDTVVEIIK